ncbi:MAG: transglutaminaseTgpA domain-containing protein, partial [Anaerolineales bacterium]
MASIGQPRRVQQPPPPLGFFERWQRRIRNHIRQALARGDLVTMLMTIIMLSMPALAMESAGLADGILILLPIVLVGAALGYFLSWSSLSEGSALFISTVYGLSLILLLSILFLGEGGSLPARTTDLIDRVNEWTIAVDTDTPSDDNIVLVLIMAVLFWFLGHNTVWHLFRIDRVWRAILPPGLILLINNADYTGDAPLQIYLIIYVLIALLLVVRSHADAREYDWYRNRVRYPRQMRRYFLRIGAAMSLVFVLFAWLLPTLQPDGIDDFSQALSDLNEALEQLFGSDDGESVTTAEFYGGDQLELSGAIQLSDQPVFEVTVAENIGYRFYWRSTAFDTYVGGTWEHYRSVRASKEEGDLTLNIGTFLPGARQSVSQEFQMLLSASSLVYAAPQPTLFELPMRVELDCIDDLSSFECVNNNAPVDVSITRPFNLLREGDRYNVTSLVSVADADALRTASTEYPAWVTNRYLQGTEQVTPRLLELTQGIVANANNPYDRAKAIERWLRMNLAYDELIPQPPEGQDPVDWFVFDIQRGYCNYYASAMILMLRSQGIPARMAAGFSQGEFDPANNQYLVRERDAHTWVEVYFP